MGKNFRETLAEQMKDPEFRKVWDAGTAERERLRAQIEADESTLQPNQKRKGGIIYELS